MVVGKDAWAEARTCHGEPGPAAEPGPLAMFEATQSTPLSSAEACDLQDSLGQQRVPV